MERGIVRSICSFNFITFLLCLIEVSSAPAQQHEISIADTMVEDKNLSCLTKNIPQDVLKVCQSVTYPASDTVDVSLANKETFLCLLAYDMFFKICNYSSHNVTNPVAVMQELAISNSSFQLQHNANRSELQERKVAFCTKLKGLTLTYEKTKPLLSPFMIEFRSPANCVPICFDLGPISHPLCLMLARIQDIDQTLKEKQAKLSGTTSGTSHVAVKKLLQPDQPSHAENEMLPHKEKQQKEQQPETQHEPATEQQQQNEPPQQEKHKSPQQQQNKPPQQEKHKSPQEQQPESQPEQKQELERNQEEEQVQQQEHQELTKPEQKQQQQQQTDEGKLTAIPQKSAETVHPSNQKKPHVPSSVTSTNSQATHVATDSKSVDTPNKEAVQQKTEDDTIADVDETRNSPLHLKPEVTGTTISDNTQEHEAGISIDDRNHNAEDPMASDDVSEIHADVANQNQNRPEPSEQKEPLSHYRSMKNEEDSHFFTYFTIISLVCIAGYVGYHNKQKVLAIVLEGRRSRTSRNRRRPSTASYRKLDCTLEEAVTSQCNANVTHVIY